MPEPDFYVKQGDSAAPVLARTLLDEEGDPVDINLATVRFHMLPIAGGAVKVDAAATNHQSGPGPNAANQGQVSYAFTASNTDTAGVFIAEWEVTFTGGAVLKFPNTGYMLIRINEKIA